MNIKKKKSGEGGANWMDTYGDMVTLLLCFFVLLYSMSTIDEKKWQIIVQSFNPSIVNNLIEKTDTPEGPQGSTASTGGEGMAPTEEEMKESLEELYLALTEYIEENNMENSVSITQGEGYVFLTFRDAVFFGPDSSVLLPDGKDVLRSIAPMFLTAEQYIQETRIMGHTARATPGVPNGNVTDRVLSADRAAQVAAFLQGEGLQGQKIVTAGYGEWRSIDTNETSAGRAHNRRVEIMVTGIGLEDQLGEGLREYETVVNDARQDIFEQWAQMTQ